MFIYDIKDPEIKKDTFQHRYFLMEQVRGIEPPCRPWQGRVLPLNYTCRMAVQTRIELAISSVTGRHVNHYTTGPANNLNKRMAE
jgi:hypothetical protein